MVGSRTLTALVGLLLSIVVSILLWWYLDTLLVFLLVPFVPFLFRGVRGKPDEEPSVMRNCPRCGFQTRNDEFEYCPRDGRHLERQNY